MSESNTMTDTTAETSTTLSTTEVASTLSTASTEVTMPMSQKTLAVAFYMRQSSDLKKARDEIRHMGIRTSYNPKVMIFYTSHVVKNNISSAYAQESNGLILEQGTWRPLVVPPRSLRFNIDTDTSNKFLHQGLYHIYKATDGTSFNMYHYDGRWIISTAKGYDMNSVCWDSLSYQTIISQCLESIGLTWETFTDLLDKSRCYSFGFKHPNFHKFDEGRDTPVHKIWFIQSVNLDVTSNEYLWSSDKTPIGIIEPQPVYCGPVNNLKELYKIASCSLESFLSNKTVNYGFILRSVNFEATRLHSDLYIESALMRSIRRFWYENNLIDLCHKNRWPKETAVTFNAFLDRTTRENFRVLFGRHTSPFAEYTSVLDTVVQYMIELSKSRALASNNTSNISNSLSSTANSVVRYAAEVSLQSFIDNTKYNLTNKSDEEKRRIFSDFVCNPASLELLMPIVLGRSEANTLMNRVDSVNTAVVNDVANDTTTVNDVEVVNSTAASYPDMPELVDQVNDVDVVNNVDSTPEPEATTASASTWIG